MQNATPPDLPHPGGGRRGNLATQLAAFPNGLNKVLNNNVVVSVSADGTERVLMGRGIGFGLKPTDIIDPARIEKTFVLQSGTLGERDKQILTETPYSIIQAVTRSFELAESILGQPVRRAIALAIIDHIKYAVERLQQGIQIPIAMPVLRVLHPNEYAAATKMVESISQSLGIDLPAEESIVVAMHLLNIDQTEAGTHSTAIYRSVQQIVSIAETGLAVTLDPESLDYVRFVLHIQFLLQRIATGAALSHTDVAFTEFIQTQYPRSFTIAQQVRVYLSDSQQIEVPDNELLYVAVHIERLAQQVAGT